MLDAAMPVAKVGALVRAGDQPNRVQSWPTAAACEAPAQMPTAKAASAAPIAIEMRRTELSFSLPAQQNAAELVFLAGLEDRENLVAGLERRRADGDLRAALAHDGDQPRALGELQPFDTLAGRRRVAIDLHLDDLEILLPQLEQVDQVVLGHL